MWHCWQLSISHVRFPLLHLTMLLPRLGSLIQKLAAQKNLKSNDSQRRRLHLMSMQAYRPHQIMALVPSRNVPIAEICC